MKHCLDCGRPCSRRATRCRPCSNRHKQAAARGKPVLAGRKAKRGARVARPDGSEYLSMTALACELGCSRTALYWYAEWAGDHWCLRREPDPRSCGRRGGNRLPRAP